MGLGPIIAPWLLPSRLLKRQDTNLRNRRVGYLTLALTDGKRLRNTVPILDCSRAGSHVLDHYAKEFRTNNWSAFFACIESLSSLPIQKEELIP